MIKTKMESDKRCALLAKRIAEILRGDLELSKEILDYIDSTFSNPSLKELEEIINNESNCEKDSLLELIFFPDESIQIQLEDLLEREAFQKTDEKKVFNYLLLQGVETIIHFPNRRGSLKLTLPYSAAAQFVNRLNIANNPDQRLVESTDKYVAEKAKDLVRVKLRNSRFPQSENIIVFICSFLEKMDSERNDFFECFDFILNFLDEVHDDNNLFDALQGRREFYLANLQKAQKLEQNLKKKNVETSILQDERIPYINKEEMLSKIATIDKIILIMTS